MMMQKITRLQTIFIPFLGLCLLCASIFLAGGSLLFFCLAVLYAWLSIYLPGAVFATYVKAKEARLFYTAALTFGFGLFACMSLLASMTGQVFFLWVLPVFGLLGAVKYRLILPQIGQNQNKIYFFYLMTVLVFCISTVLIRIHPQQAGFIIPDHDFYWNLGNIQSFLQGFPPQDLRWSDGVLTYHWLTELFSAGIVFAVGITPYDAAAFFMPALLLCSVILVLRECCAIWCAPMTKAKEILFLSLVLYGAGAGLWKVLERGTSPFGNLFFRHLFTNINGVATATLFLAVFANFVFVLWHHKSSLWKESCLFLAFILLTLAKGPIAGIVSLALFCASAAFLFYAFWKREFLQKAGQMFLRAVLLGAVFVVCYQILFSAGASASVYMNVEATISKFYFANLFHRATAVIPALYPFWVLLFWALQTLCFTPFGVLASIACVVLCIRKRRVPSLPWLFVSAMICGGFLAFYLFDHESLSQMYFAFSALFFTYLAGMRYWSFVQNRFFKIILSFACFITLLTGAFTVFWMGQQVVSIKENQRDLPLTAQEEQAMEFLSQKQFDDHVFITNRIHTGKALEGLSNVYSGLSGRKFYLESFKYAMSNLGVSLQQVLERVQEVKAVFQAPTAQQAVDRLPNGVTGIIYSKRADDMKWDILEGEQNFAPFWKDDPALDLIYENKDVIIYMKNQS